MDAKNKVKRKNVATARRNTSPSKGAQPPKEADARGAGATESALTGTMRSAATPTPTHGDEPVPIDVGASFLNPKWDLQHDWLRHYEMIPLEIPSFTVDRSDDAAKKAQENVRDDVTFNARPNVDKNFMPR